MYHDARMWAEACRDVEECRSSFSLAVVFIIFSSSTKGTGMDFYILGCFLVSDYIQDIETSQTLQIVRLKSVEKSTWFPGQYSM